jgi:hypothetical protein
MREERNLYKLFLGKPEEEGRLERSRQRLVDNIRMDLGEAGWGGVDWIGLVPDIDKWRALMSSVMNLRFPQNAGKLSSSFTAGGP